MVSVCEERYLTPQKQPTPCLWVGMGLGLFSALITGWIGFTSSGHQLNDPIALGLAVSSLPRGLLYFDWSGLFQALGYSAGLGVLSWLSIQRVAVGKNQALLPEESQRTAVIAALTSVIPVLLREIDSFPVLLWYGIATMFSLLLAGFLAKIMCRYGHRLLR